MRPRVDGLSSPLPGGLASATRATGAGAAKRAPASLSRKGRASREKGKRRERGIVQAHLELGIHAERVPLSGAAHYQGRNSDVDIYPFGKDAAPLCCEVKARAGGQGFITLEKWLADNDILFLVRDNAPAVAVLPWATYRKLILAIGGSLSMPSLTCNLQPGD